MELIITLFMLVLMLKVTGFLFRIGFKILGGILGFVGLLIIAALAIPLIGILFLPAIIVIALVGVLFSGPRIVGRL